MAKKTGEELLDEVKKTGEELLGDVKKAAAPTVKKVRQAAKPAAAKAAKAGADAAQAVKETAKKVTPKKTEYYVQFAGQEIDMETLSEKAKAAFKEDHKRTAILSCRVYLKPEDHAAYYVVNDVFFGRIDL